MIDSNTLTRNTTGTSSIRQTVRIFHPEYPTYNDKTAKKNHLLKKIQ